MKKIIIPHLKTSCGELFYGHFAFIDNKIVIELSYKGSQLLEYICVFFVKIVNNHSIQYLLAAKKIFWRVNNLPIKGSRKEMVEETFDALINYIVSSINQLNN
jgi:hypothetical protein